MQEYEVEDVAVHKTKDNLWVIIHGKGKESLDKCTTASSLHFSNKVSISL